MNIEMIKIWVERIEKAGFDKKEAFKTVLGVVL